jgi:hypothetical protein
MILVFQKPDETLNIWDKQKIGWCSIGIRKFQPDVIIMIRSSFWNYARHHTASARVSKVLIFNNATIPEFKVCQTLATQASVFNTSWWFYGSQEKFDADKTKLTTVKRYLLC